MTARATNRDVVDSINRLSDRFESFSSQKPHDVEERVLLLESDIARIDRSIGELDTLVKEQGVETSKFREDFFQKLETVSAKAKPDWQVILSGVSILLLLCGAFWGLAISPINGTLERNREDRVKIENRLEKVENEIDDHESLEGHPVSVASTKHSLECITKLEDKVDSLEETIQQHLLEIRSPSP